MRFHRTINEKVYLRTLSIFTNFSHAAPKWELANVFITNKDKGEISKIYVDKNSIKTAPNNNDIRYFSIKEVHSNPKNNVVKNNLAIECSQGLFLSPFTNQWEPIFQRGYIIGTLKPMNIIAIQLFDDVRGKYSNNIIINTNRIDFNNSLSRTSFSKALL